MNAVIYARYSSEKQNEKSIEDQLKACKEFAEENGFTIVNQYVDRAKSGKTDHRPGFQQMIKDSAQKKFKFVLCWKFDRISRNTRDYYYYEKVLFDNDVKVVSVNEQIEDPQAAPIIKAVNLGMAESFNVTLAINVNRGMRSNAQKCKSNGALPVGYQSDKEGTIELDPEKAPYIKNAFKLFLKGYSYTDIANYLNDEGVKTRKGKLFTGNAVKRILRNPTYSGVYKFQDIVIKDGIPATIDKATFNEVQEKMKSYSRPHNNKENQERYYLINKLYCYKCNKPMDISCGTSKTGKTYRYYKCDCGSVRKDYIESLVISLTKQYILTDESINDIADYVIALQKEIKKNSKERSLKNELKEIEKKIDNICDLFINGLDSQAMRDKLEKLENEKAQLEIRISLEETYNQDLTRDQVIWYLKRFQNMEEGDKELEEQLIKDLIMYVYLYEDKIWIQYTYAEKQKDTQTLSLKELECSTNSQMVDLNNFHSNNFTRINSNIFISHNGYYIILKEHRKIKL